MKDNVTTGGTGNIALDEVNDGYTYILSPICAGHNVYLRVWVADQGSSGQKYYLTATNPNTGATVNNTSLNIRYIVLRLYSIK